MSLQEMLAACRVTDGKAFRLAHHDPNGKLDGLDKEKGEALLPAIVERIAAQQERLHADARWSLLCIFQAMDAAGKDGTIKKAFSGVNPAGVNVTSYIAPSTLERGHDFMWRHNIALPRRGMIGVQNRSWYEEVLVVRVVPEILKAAPLPAAVVGKSIWEDRLEDIAAHERYLARQGTLVLKFFLHLSPEEQKKRLLARIDEPAKNWKFRTGDLADRARWDAFMQAYEEMIRATAAPHAPWFVLPADRKWLTHLLAAEAVASALEELKLEFPKVDAAQEEELKRARTLLG